MSGRAGAGASSILKCPACGKGRRGRETCWVLHPHKAPEWLQDKLKSKKIGKGGQAKPHVQGGGAGKECPHKGGKFPPCKACRSTLHLPEVCWAMHPELSEKSKAKGRLGKQHNWDSCGQRCKSKKIDQARRDMSPSLATVCPIMRVNEAQAWEDSYCTRPVSCITGSEEEMLRVPQRSDCLVYLASVGPRAILGLPFSARYGLVVLQILDAFLCSRTFVKAALGMTWIINVLIWRRGHHCPWRAAGSLSRISMGWSMTGSCAAPFKTVLQYHAWMTRT